MKFLKRPQSWVTSLLLLLILAASIRSIQAPTQDNSDPIRPGIQVLLEDSLHIVQGKKVGLVTNQTGVDSNGLSSIDLLFSHPQVDLVALFSPEHGIRGDLGPGELGAALGTSGNQATNVDTEVMYEAYYSYPVNDGMTVTPLIYVKEKATTGTPDETGIMVKTSFSF